MKSKAGKPARLCKICGRTIKQKYFSLCIYCRKDRKAKKKQDAEIRKVVRWALR